MRLPTDDIRMVVLFAVALLAAMSLPSGWHG
jgi:hypothetical protein